MTNNSGKTPQNRGNMVQNGSNGNEMLKMPHTGSKMPKDVSEMVGIGPEIMGNCQKCNIVYFFGITLCLSIVADVVNMC